MRKVNAGRYGMRKTVLYGSLSIPMVTLTTSNVIQLAQVRIITFNPYLTNGFAHHYQLDESTFNFRGFRGDFYFLSHFLMKFLCANRIAPDVTPRCGVTSGAILFAFVPKKERQA